MKESSAKRIFSKLASIVLALALVASMLSCATIATSADVISVWDGSTSTDGVKYDGGDGSESSPYLISNGAELYKMVTENNTAALSQGRYFKLTNDIYLNDVENDDILNIATPTPWVSNGTSSYIFAGNLDGDGYTVYGLYIKANGARAGLFPQISGNAQISNLTISKSYIETSGGRSGAFAGAVWSQANAGLSKCYVDSSVTIIGKDSAGGMIGYLHNDGATVHFENCASLANISGTQTGTTLGGLLGGTASSNCYVYLSNCWTTYSSLIKNQGVQVKQQDVCYTVQPDQIIGAGAKTTMPLLDWTNVWQTTEGGYPVFRTEAAEEPEEYVNKYWDGAAASAYTSGNGTKSNPYKISSAAELYKMVSENGTADANVYYFELANDIYVNDIENDNWLSNPTVWFKGDGNYYFNDHLNGNGYTVYGMYCGATTARSGLFPQISDGATVTNLTISDSLIVGTSGRSGAIAGAVNKSGSGVKVEISNCAVVNTSVQGHDSAGGLIGLFSNNSCVIANCAFNGSVTPNGKNYTGGIAADGWGASCEIKNSYSVGVYPISGTANTKNNVIRTNVYTNIATAPSDDKAVSGITTLEVANMKGETAKANMLGFNYNTVWKTVDNDFPILFAPSEVAEYWDGTASDSYAGGEGTKESPYEISTPAELLKLANAGAEETSGKYFELTSNIDLVRIHDGWETDNGVQWAQKEVFYNSYNNEFCGNFNGNGYTVRGIYSNLYTTANRAVGLFPTVGANAVIKNVNIDGVYIVLNGNGKFTNYAGAVAGYAGAAGADLNYAVTWPQIVGCTVTNADIVSSYAGGIAGGTCGGLKIEACSFAGTVDTNETAGGAIGGIIGDNAGKCEIANCYTATNTLAGKTDGLSTLANGVATADGLNENVWDISGATPVLKDITFITENSETIADDSLNAVRSSLLGIDTDYIVSVNETAGIDILDFISAKLAVEDTVSDAYKLIWSEEFNGNTIDSNVWGKQQNMGTEGDLKLDWNNAAVENGNLVMSTTYDENDSKYAVAGNLNTKDSMSFIYGKLEVRAKVPFGAGSFPSLWLATKDALGADADPEYTTEIDIFEVMAQEGNATSLHANAHKHYTDKTDYQYIWSGDIQNSIAVAEKDAYHIFTFEWTEEKMSAAIDGSVYFELYLDQNFDASGKTTDMSQFNAPMYIMINNHMFTPDNAQDKYKYNGTDEITSPMEYDIDYIRLYQKADHVLNLQ